ncbi:MAG: hypothetical protein II712_05245 [Erysipelotrichaceae bacterium]|nr:hypothetical protein [Erysipelotrichaceae bacterium]
MIYLVIVSFVACIGLAGYVAGLNARFRYMQADFEKFKDSMISVSMHVADLEKIVEENGDEHKAEELEKLLEKKWEDAIQTISDFDPFRVGEEK